MVISASGKLNTRPISPPFSQFGIGRGILKIIKPTQKRLMNDAVIARVLSSKDINIIGIIEAMPKIVPAITPFTIFVMYYFFKS